MADVHDSSALRAILSTQVAAAIDASHVEWWQRDGVGAYTSRFGTIVGQEAAVLDAWIVAGEPWRAGTTRNLLADDALGELVATGARLVVPIRQGVRPLGLLAVGGCSNGRIYDDRDVGVQ